MYVPVNKKKKKTFLTVKDKICQILPLKAIFILEAYGRNCFKVYLVYQI